MIHMNVQGAIRALKVAPAVCYCNSEYIRLWWSARLAAVAGALFTEAIRLFSALLFYLTIIYVFYFQQPVR